MAAVNPYLTFHGQCEEAFKFYESAFGTKVPFWSRFGDMPAQEGMPLLTDEYKKPNNACFTSYFFGDCNYGQRLSSGNGRIQKRK